MDYNKIKEAATGYKEDMTRFLRDLVRIPGESCGEKGHIMRI
ncbi:MAG: YgeY family selenium metabolism-linked hydrolase, partial [Blautia sp.]|nr:YgeY family selenium metabolism-linked hydrolase [Blautia sp.]